MNNCLVVGPAWVGDMVMAQVLFKLLKQQQPDRQIDVLAPAWGQSLLVHMPEVRHILTLDCAHKELGLNKRYQLGLSLRNQYEEAILCPNSFKSALVPYWANIPKRTGWRGEWRYGVLNDVRVLDKQKYPLMIERFAALAFPKDSTLPATLPFPEFVVDKESVQKIIARFQIQLNKPILILCPGAEYGSSKRWPEAYHQEVATFYLKAGWQVWILGAQKDNPVSNQIMGPIQSQGEIYNFCGKTTLSEAIELISLANKVLTNDSGLMHIAAAMGKPLVAVYGSSSPSFTPPLSQYAKTLNTDVACRPCFKRECPLGHHDCMKKLTPAMVLDALSENPS